jgi:hypothetical protein
MTIVFLRLFFTCFANSVIAAEPGKQDKPNKHCLVAMVVMILAAGCSNKTFPDKSIHIWNVAEWSITNPGVPDNPFDLIADVIFTHENGETRETQMFYDGGSTWKFRFC